MAKLSDTQIGALRLLKDRNAPRLERASGHPVTAPTGKTWDRLKALGYTEMGANGRTALSAKGEELLASLS